MDMAKPTIRFKGYQDDWEQRKLGDIGKARSGVGFPDAEQGGVTGIPFFKVSDMNLDGNENEMTVANNYVTAEQIAVHRWSPITELPAIFFAKVGAAVMLNRKRLCRFPFLLDNNTMAYSLSSTKWDADFAKALFGTVDLTSLVQVGALPSYNARDVESMEIYLPSLLEQEQIGGFFKQLDTLITLHQRKCDETKRLKKYMLQKMFPQNGEKVPEIRFSGFTDDWEQRKLGDVVEDYVEKTTVEDQYPVLTSSQRKGIVLQDDFFAGDRVNQNGNIGYFIIPRGYFAFRSRSDNDVFVFNRNDAVDMGIISYFYPVFKPRGVDSDFLLRRLNYGLEDQIKINSEGTGQHVLSLKKFKNMIGLFPSYEEQKKIGSYFSQIDHLITLHQRELENLQNIKKFMLGKMFV